MVWLGDSVIPVTLNKLLWPPARFPEHLRLPGNRFPFLFAQIKRFDLSTGRAREILRSSAGDDDLEYLAAFVATNRQIHREVKRQIFHSAASRLTLRITGGALLMHYMKPGRHRAVQ